MKVSDLRKYGRFYTNPAYMGVDGIFRRYFGLPDDHPVPLSVAHGVDFGHTFYPQDVKSFEPIHWSCNADMHARALAYKPSLLLPHPWVMVIDEAPPAASDRATLVIGPPPGPVNDERLFRLIEKSVGPDWSILVKARGAHQQSLRFWEERGLTPVTAGAPDAGFYGRLAAILASHRRIVGPTFSSALVFAASIGREVQLLRGFTHRTLEPRGYELEVDWASPRARAVVTAFAGGDQAEVRAISNRLLGADLAVDRPAKLNELYDAIGRLAGPFWMNPEIGFPPGAVRRALALAFRKPGLINAGMEAYLDRFRRSELSVMSVNEFDVWLNGKSPDNFQLEPVVRGRGGGVAGYAAEGYGA